MSYPVNLTDLLGTHAERAIVSLSLISVSAGIPLCALQLAYMIHAVREKAGLGNRIYLGISGVDLAIVISYLPVTASLLSYRSPLLFANPGFCAVWGVGWFTLVRLSIFLIAMLSVTRTWALLRPFSKPPQARRLLYLGLGYGVVMLGQATLPFWLLEEQEGVDEYEYFWQAAHCQPTLDSFNPTLKVLVYILEIIAPLFLVSASCAVSFFALRARGATSMRGADASRRGSRRATTTILLLTLVYILFNAPLVTINILTLAEQHLEFFPSYRDFLWSRSYIHLHDLTNVVSVPLNSATNALVWMCRSGPMREWIGGLLQEGVRRLQGKSNDVPAKNGRPVG